MTEPKEVHSELTKNADLAQSTFTGGSLQNTEGASRAGPEAHARISTENSTDLQEKVMITNDIVIAWPIRLSAVRTFKHNSDSTMGSRENSPEPEISGTTVRHTLWLHLKGIHVKRNLNIQTHVKITKSSPTCKFPPIDTAEPDNVADQAQLCLPPTAIAEHLPGADGTEAQVISPDQNATSPVESPTPVTSGDLQMINGMTTSEKSGSLQRIESESVQSRNDPVLDPGEDMGEAKVEETKQEDSIGMENRQSSANEANGCPEDRVDENQEETIEAQDTICSENPQHLTDVNKISDQIDLKVDNPPQSGEQDSEEDRVEAKVEEQTEQESLVRVEDRQPSANEATGCPEDRVNENQEEMIGGQAIICAGHPQHLIDVNKISVDQIDLKVDNPPQSSTEIGITLKQGQLRTRNSYEFEIGGKNEEATRLTAAIHLKTAGNVKRTAVKLSSTPSKHEVSIAINNESESSEELEAANKPETSTFIPQVGDTETRDLSHPEHNADILTSIPLNVDNMRTDVVRSEQSQYSEAATESKVKDTIESEEPVFANSSEPQHSIDMRLKTGDDQIAGETIVERRSSDIHLSTLEQDQVREMDTVEQTERIDGIENPLIVRNENPEQFEQSGVDRSRDQTYSETSEKLVKGALQKAVNMLATDEPPPRSSIRSDMEQDPPDRTILSSDNKTLIPETEEPDEKQTVNDKIEEIVSEPPPNGTPEHSAEQQLADVVSGTEALTKMPDTLLSSPVPMQDAQVDTKFSELANYTEGEESEWSHTTYQQRYHHYRHGGDKHHKRADLEVRESQKPSVNHFGQKFGSSHVRSHTIPRAYPPCCGVEECVAKLSADIRDPLKPQSDVRLNETSESSDTLSSETSELQRVTMTLLNTLTTTAKLLRNQYRRRKKSAKRLANKSHKNELDQKNQEDGQMAQSKKQEEILEDTGIACNSSCAVESEERFERMKTKACSCALKRIYGRAISMSRYDCAYTVTVNQRRGTYEIENLISNRRKNPGNGRSESSPPTPKDNRHVAMPLQCIDVVEIAEMEVFDHPMIRSELRTKCSGNSVEPEEELLEIIESFDSVRLESSHETRRATLP